MTTDAPAYISPSPSSPAPPRRRRWLLAVVAAWAVLLAALSYVSVRNDPATVREQRDLAEAVPVVDRAIGDLITAAGPEAVFELTAPKVESGCRVTPFRDGAILRRGITVYTPEAEIRGLLDRIAERLPASYRAGVRETDGGLRLRADAGDFVLLLGRPAGSGRVRLTADTGCRPVPAGFTVSPPDNAGQPAEQELNRVLAALGVTGSGTPERATAPCPGGGTSGTVRATAEARTSGSLATALRPLAADAVVVTDTPELYAYRAGALSVVAEVVDDQTRVAVSTGC